MLQEAGNHTNALPLSVENVFSMSHTVDEEQPDAQTTLLPMAETPLIRARRSVTQPVAASTNLFVQMPNGTSLPLTMRWTDTVEQVKMKKHGKKHPRFERHGNYAYYNGHRGDRHRHPGWRYYNGYWFPPAAFLAAIIGGAILLSH